jgi:hypothetical protein
VEVSVKAMEGIQEVRDHAVRAGLLYRERNKRKNSLSGRFLSLLCLDRRGSK